MSFTQEVKTEICNNELLVCCKKAELAAIIQMNGSLSISARQLALEIKSQNPTIAKRTLSLLKQLFAIESEVQKIQQFKFDKKNSYLIKIKNNAKLILEELTLWDKNGFTDHPAAILLRKDCCGRAYLAGAFLAGGSINSPRSTNYHWEISCHEPAIAQYIVKLLARYTIKAKIIERRKKPLVYLKQSEKIGDFLRLTGAYEALMKFEDARIQRDYVNSIYRLDNCDIANEMRAQKSAGQQIIAINSLLTQVETQRIDEKLNEVLQLRLENPESSYSDLSLLYEKRYHRTLSKSGIRHRLNKIAELAKKNKN